ncbi:hypothetical protein RRF57_002578 [Xylaria bambusicola]|uniref:Uncharacterized protein n=1 Tax=Xylaria bambusicola TaxID=326684 RepID=A0AAN7UDV0_9PEZI
MDSKKAVQDPIQDWWSQFVFSSRLLFKVQRQRTYYDQAKHRYMYSRTLNSPTISRREKKGLDYSASVRLGSSETEC